MAITIGSRGLEEVNLEIPQGTSLSFDITHLDESDQPIDHTGTTCRMAFQNAKNPSEMYDLSDCCIPTSTGFVVTIPMSKTLTLPVSSSKSKLVWDLIVYSNDNDSTCVCYGMVTVDDTYALDGD
jgi:hypothetical protein